MIRTYAVGRSNSAVRLDNHTGPWVDLTPNGDNDTLWRDVMSDPSNPDKVVIVGGQNDGFNIQVSSDAGVTWGVPSGDWVDCDHFYEVWYVDTDIIWAVGVDGQVAISIDGGLNFNVTATRPGLSVAGDVPFTAGIHALDDQVAVVLGSPDELVTSPFCYAWKTIDGGATWNILNGGVTLTPQPGALTPYVGKANGIWISPDQQKITAGTGYSQQLSTDGGVTFIDVDIYFPRSGNHFTWFPDYDPNPQYFRHTGGVSYIVAESTDFGLSYTDIRSLYSQGVIIQILGAHFYAPYDGYYAYHDQGITYIDSTNDGGATGTVSHTNLDPASSYEAIWTSVEQPPFTPCFELTDCAGILNPIYTQSDLSSQDGMVVTLADDTNHEIEGCWFVTATTISCPDTVEVEVYRCYDDCADCLPPDPEPRIPCPRPVDPGYDTGNCDPDVVEKAKCTFAEMKYQQMISKRYAIEYCCQPDEMAVIIEKEKVDLLLLKGNDPTPDLCNPECFSYEIEIDPADSAVTTYVDCFDVEQVILTAVGENGLLPTIVGFCALNTTPPTSTVTHPDDSTDTYIIERGDECVPPWVNPRACIGYNVQMSNFTSGDQVFRYLDCDGIEVAVTKVGNFKDIAQYNFCGLEGQTIVREEPFAPSDVFSVTEGPCTGRPPCVEYTVTLQSSVGGSFRYTDCNGVLASQPFVAQLADQIFVFCGESGQTLGCKTCNYFLSVEGSDC